MVGIDRVCLNGRVGKVGGTDGMGRKRSGGGVHLQRRLRRQHHARTAADVHRLAQRVAGEDARPGADDDDVGGAAEVKDAADAERRLGVRVRHNRSLAALFKHELEASRSPDGLGRTTIW